jgi:hypothetical protein
VEEDGDPPFDGGSDARVGELGICISSSLGVIVGLFLCGRIVRLKIFNRT